MGPKTKRVRHGEEITDEAARNEEEPDVNEEELKIMSDDEVEQEFAPQEADAPDEPEPSPVNEVKEKKKKKKRKSRKEKTKKDADDDEAEEPPQHDDEAQPAAEAIDEPDDAPTSVVSASPVKRRRSPVASASPARSPSRSPDRVVLRKKASLATVTKTKQEKNKVGKD